MLLLEKLTKEMNDCTKQSSSHILKNPAAGGGVRSSSSPHQPAVGTPPNQDSPFVRAIFTRIKNEAEDQKFALDASFLCQVRQFARKYAEANPPRNPPKGKIFGQHHVDAAFERFKEQYEPPQPAPQQTHRPSQRDLLMSQIGKEGIGALPRDLQERYDAVVKMSEAGCFLFGQQLPDTQLLQKQLCESTGAGVLLVLFDIHKGTDGTLNLRSFVQKRDFQRRPMQFCPMTQGSIVLVCVRCIGDPRPQQELQLSLNDIEVEARSGGGEVAYNHAGQQVNRQFILSKAQHDMKADLRHSKRSDFVPYCEEDFLPSSKSYHCSKEFKSICNQVMTKAGAIPLPSSSSSAATAATAATEMPAPSVDVAGEAPCGSDFILCYHHKTVRNGDKYFPCDLCLAPDFSGRGRIMDMWGRTVIAYKHRE